MYSIHASFSQAVDDPAPALPNTGIGAGEMVYAHIANATGNAAWVVAAGGTAGDGYLVPTGETWEIGPILGADLPKWGLFAAAADTVTCRYVTAPPFLRTAPITMDVTRNPIVVPTLPFSFRQIA